MPCIPLPKLPLPTLPSPLSIKPKLPSLSVQANLCCQIPLVSGSVSIPIDPTIIQPPLVAVVNATVATIRTYLDALSITCPRD